MLCVCVCVCVSNSLLKEVVEHGLCERARVYVAHPQ